MSWHHSRGACSGPYKDFRSPTVLPAETSECRYPFIYIPGPSTSGFKNAIMTSIVNPRPAVMARLAI